MSDDQFEAAADYHLAGIVNGGGHARPRLLALTAHVRDTERRRAGRIIDRATEDADPATYRSLDACRKALWECQG